MPKNYFDLTGKCALITGANSGLGLGFAHALAKSGADVTIWGRNEAKTEAALAQLKTHGTKVYSRIVDVSKEQEVIDGMRDAADRMGRLDCVIQNAGGVSASPIHEMTSEMYHELIDTAQHGGFYTLREAAKHMVERSKRGDRGGSIILCGSLTIFSGALGVGHYGAAKGAMNSMSKAMALELGPYGIRVNVVAIGMVVTGMMAQNMERAKPGISKTEARTPLGRIGNTEDMDGIIMYLASDMSRWHTGDTIVIDGGYTSHIQ